MGFHTCVTCRTAQRVDHSQVVHVDEGELTTVAWWRCRTCDQLSPSADPALARVAELALSA